VKVRAFLERRAPETRWPAASTIGALFDQEGLTVKRRLRRRAPPAGAPFAACAGANDVWAIDFKGWFLTGDGTHCEPLTLSDAHSRYVLRCQVLPKSDAEHVWPVLDATFREFGPRVRPAGAAALRQRPAVCLHRRRRPVAAGRAPRQGGGDAGAHRPG
jgi:transposase InsO family protein